MEVDYATKDTSLKEIPGNISIPDIIHGNESLKALSNSLLNKNLTFDNFYGVKSCSKIHTKAVSNINMMKNSKMVKLVTPNRFDSSNLFLRYRNK